MREVKMDSEWKRWDSRLTWHYCRGSGPELFERFGAARGSHGWTTDLGLNRSRTLQQGLVGPILGEQVQ